MDSEQPQPSQNDNVEPQIHSSPLFYEQPGQFVPPQQPQKRRSPWQWYKSKGRFTKLGLGCGFIFLLLMLCTCSLAAFGSTLPPRKTVQPGPDTNSAVGQIVTSAATPTDRPTLSPSPIATPTNTPVQVAPTDTPTPTATPIPTVAPLTDKAAIEKQLKADVSNAQLQGDIISSGYGANDNAFINIGLNPPLTMSQADQLTLVQTDCFNAQKTVWQDPLLQKIGYLDVYIFTQDDQGLPVNVGECIMHPADAAKVDWNNLDPQTAWDTKIYSDMLAPGQ